MTIATDHCYDAGRIREMLSRNQDMFVPPLMERVDLHEYSKKLAENARNIFLTDGSFDVAHAAVYVNRPPVSYLSSFCVDRARQHLGYGTTLMSAVIDCCRVENCDVLRLRVALKNETARAFYVKHGFLVIGEIGEDLVMSREVGRKEIASEVSTCSDSAVG